MADATPYERKSVSLHFSKPLLNLKLYPTHRLVCAHNEEVIYVYQHDSYQGLRLDQRQVILVVQAVAGREPCNLKMQECHLK